MAFATLDPGVAEKGADDLTSSARLPWLTPRNLIIFTIGWLVLFALLSAFISDPFQSEPSAAADPNYARVMFLHGLLIGMVGLAALLTCQVMALRSLHIRVWIAGGTVAATVLASVGGIWDRTIPGSEVPMWTQILGFFALDEILVLLVAGLYLEWRQGAAASRGLPFLAAAVASTSMFVAAVMGHLTGWIMEFGVNTPPVIGDYMRFAGFASADDFIAALRGSHSHDMAVGSMALAAALLAQQFGFGTLTGAARWVGRLGMSLIAGGGALMSVMYVAMGFTTWSPPTLFTSGGANGIAGDDIITGVLVMGGGLLVVGAMAFSRAGGAASSSERPVRLAAIWAWVLSVASVAVAGYWIELHETRFGAGDAHASGVANDAIFTWLHQDFGLFLLPTLILVMLAVERLVDYGHPGWIGWTTIAGTTVAFVGGYIWVFLDPSLHGPGYVVSSAGMLLVGLALLATLWWGIAGHLRQAAAITRAEPRPFAPRSPHVQA
jgi:hypothetical protein